MLATLFAVAGAVRQSPHSSRWMPRNADFGGLFLIGDRATSATRFDPAAPNQHVSEHSGSSNLTRLMITTADVPEPATTALLGIGMIALLCRRSFFSVRRPAARSSPL